MTSLSGTNWEKMVSELEQKRTQGGSVDTETQMSNRLFDLKRLLIRKSKTWWDTEYLRKYLQENVMPQGLRIQIFPQIFDMSSDLKDKWEQNLQMCSKNMLLILIEHHEKLLIDLNNEISIICAELENFKSLETFKIKDEEIKKQIEELNQTLINRKETKLNRDRRAYEQGKAYRWQQNKFYRRPSTRESDSESQWSTDSTTSRDSTQSEQKKTKYYRNRFPREAHKYNTRGTRETYPNQDTKDKDSNRKGEQSVSSSFLDSNKEIKDGGQINKNDKTTKK